MVTGEVVDQGDIPASAQYLLAPRVRGLGVTVRKPGHPMLPVVAAIHQMRTRPRREVALVLGDHVAQVHRGQQAMTVHLFRRNGVSRIAEPVDVRPGNTFSWR